MLINRGSGTLTIYRGPIAVIARAWVATAGQQDTLSCAPCVPFLYEVPRGTVGPWRSGHHPHVHWTWGPADALTVHAVSNSGCFPQCGPATDAKVWRWRPWGVCTSVDPAGTLFHLCRRPKGNHTSLCIYRCTHAAAWRMYGRLSGSQNTLSASQFFRSISTTWGSGIELGSSGLIVSTLTC